MTRILYVEDDRVNRLVLERYLRDDFEVTMTSDSASTLEILADDRDFEVILLDINLGEDDMNGVELFQKIKQLYPEISSGFIAVSAFVEDGDQKALFDAGFNDFHAKPVDKAGIIAQIQGLINRE